MNNTDPSAIKRRRKKIVCTKEKERKYNKKIVFIKI